MELFFGILIILITIFWIWLRYKHNYWNRYQVETVSLRKLYGKNSEHVAFAIQTIYEKMKMENKSYIGVYNMLAPALIIKDLEIVKSILITNFEAFPDRGLYSNPHNDPLSTNLVRLSGDKWKRMRQKLTPTFTSGKLKMMFPAAAAIGKRLVEVMSNQIDTHNSEVEMRDMCARFTTDVIGSVAFGLDCNSLENPQTEFRVKGDKAFFTIHPLMEAMASSYQNVFQKLGYKVFTKELIEFYSTIVRQNIAMREKDNVKRHDFLDILIELKDNTADSEYFCLQMEDVIAQAYLFFIAGFETSSSTITLALYELALNQEIQAKCRMNVRQSLEKYQEDFCYESLNEMVYIKQVIQETLRKHPVAPTIRRTCRSAFTLPGNKPLTIQPGVQIFIPVYAIQRDPNYYPEPEKFLPERFSSIDTDKRHPMTYLPFGAGPRICIAERFGIMQTMIAVAILLNNFKFSVCPNTPKQLNFDPFNNRVFSIKGGIYLNVQRIC